MSCCVGFKFNNGIYLAIDGRTSIDIDGNKYSVREDTNKYVIHQDKLYITFGCHDIVKLIQMNSKKYQDSDFETILKMSVSSERISEYINSDAQNKNCMLISSYSFDLLNNTIICRYYDTNGYHTFEQVIPDYFVFGIHQDEVYNYTTTILNSGINNLVEVLTMVFMRFNQFDIGGVWQLFRIQDNSVELMAKYSSPTDNIPIASKEIKEQILNNVHNNISKYSVVVNNQIQSPKIQGNFVLAGKMRSGEIEGTDIKGASFYDINQSSKLILSNDGQFSDMTYSRANGEELFKIYDGVDHTGMYLGGKSIGYMGVNNKFNADGVWDFSGATVNGLKITFG